ncbi:unnamed protein product, partial [Prorocentrum cordatum]
DAYWQRIAQIWSLKDDSRLLSLKETKKTYQGDLYEFYLSACKEHGQKPLTPISSCSSSSAAPEASGKVHDSAAAGSGAKSMATPAHQVDLENTDEEEEQVEPSGSGPSAHGCQGAAGQGSTQTVGAAPGSEPGEKQVLAREALTLILAGVARLGERASHTLFVIPEWNQKYRKTLG